MSSASSGGSSSLPCRSAGLVGTNYIVGSQNRYLFSGRDVFGCLMCVVLPHLFVDSGVRLLTVALSAQPVFPVEYQ